MDLIFALLVHEFGCENLQIRFTTCKWQRNPYDDLEADAICLLF